jgi:DNA-binding MurR/RpiR family transcriptional regulator
MPERQTIEEVVASHYADLSDQLRRAADIVVQNKVDVATRSLRALSAAHDLSPATLSRLSKALGFDGYDAMREVIRSAVERQMGTLSEKADRLRKDAAGKGSIFDRQAAACIANIEDMKELTPRTRIDQTVELLVGARQVVLFGAFGSSGIVEYLAYLANYFAPNWTLAGRRGASLGASLAGLGPEDVLFLVTTAPHARRAVMAAEAAAEQGASVIVVTDSHTCPSVKHAKVSLFVPTDSPQFFSSYAAMLVLMEGLIATLIVRSPEDLAARIRDAEEGNRKLGEFWIDP